MRSLAAILLLLTALASAADQPSSACPGALGCTASPSDRKAALAAYRRGVKLRNSDHAQDAFDEFTAATQLVPDNPEYLTAREVLRQQLVFDAVKRGNEQLLAHNQANAVVEFRRALALDPTNQFAAERMRDALGEELPPSPLSIRVVAAADEIQIHPKPTTADFHYRGDTRGLVEAIATTFGVTALFDDTFTPKTVRFEVTGIDFYTAMTLAGKMGKFFWSPIAEDQLIVATENPENRRRYERMSLRSFYVSGAGSVQELNELVGMLRSLFEIKMVSPQPTKSIITIRAPHDTAEAAARFLEALSVGPPQVMLDISVIEVSKDAIRNLGVNLPLQYNLFNLSNILSQLQNQPDIQQLINQLFASGGINQAGNQALSTLLAQLQSQANSILANPVATFGGGLTLMGLAIPTSSIVAQFNSNNVQTLEHVQVRSANGSPTSLLIGTRYPILNATFSPIFNSAALSKVIQNQSFIAPFPSFTYEDIGLTLKTTPQVHSDGDLTLKMEFHLRNLSGQSINGVPVITNREYQGLINMKNGETAVLAGYVLDSEQKSLRGMPGLGNLPVLKFVTGSESKEKMTDELIVLVTPHVLSEPARKNLEVWLNSDR